MQNKISSAGIAQILNDAPVVIRSLAKERDYWKKEAQATKTKEEAVKVARAMHEKGVDIDTPFDDLVAKMEKAASQGKLAEIRRALNMVGPNMASKIAQVANTDSRKSASSASEAVLNNFILGG